MNRTISERVLVLLGLVLAITLWAGDLMHLHGSRISSSALLGRDFVNVWLGGYLARTGSVDAIYDISRYMTLVREQFRIFDLYAYSYPPHSLLLAIPFSLLPYSTALGVWTLGGVGVFCHAARPYLKNAGLPVWLALLLPAGLVNIWAGQYGFLIGALALYGWRWIDDHPARSGICFGLMTLKPHLGLLVALVLLLQHRWQAIGYALMTVAAAILLSGLCFGFALWEVYVTRTLGFHSELLTQGLAAFHGMMPTTSVALMQMGAPRWIVQLGQAASAIYALAIVWLAVRRKVAATDLGLIVATATFLTLPYAFNYDMAVVSLAVAIAVKRAGTASPVAVRALLGLAWLLPLLLAPWRHFTAFGPLVLGGLLWLQLRFASEGMEATAPPAVPAGAGGGRSV